jgi:hypothetical protein
MFVKSGEFTQRALPLSQIALIERKDYIGGGWSGFILGGLGGLALGGAVGHLIQRDGEMGGLRVVPTIYGAALGAGVGTIVGAFIGNTLRYKFAINGEILQNDVDSSSVIEDQHR